MSLQARDDELKINGVVYNEMKGAYSSPDEGAFKPDLPLAFPPDNTYSKRILAAIRVYS